VALVAGIEPLAAPSDEADLQVALDAADYAKATRLMLLAYGNEVYDLLHALHRDGADADDAFSLFAEGLWQSMPRFERRCSPRTWAYAIARRAPLRQRRAEPVLRLTPELADLAERLRTETSPLFRTERRSRLLELRDALPEDDRLVLMLRVDRRLTWDELVVVLHGDTSLDEEGRVREAARLRKRFQLVRERLREAARRAGLLQTTEEEP
jgi:RNA polymerase sigma-70 factor (ECF subfamily)